MKRFFKGDKRNKKLRNAHGYTMAEVLMVVAILGILAAVSFMGVFAMRRNMTQTQADKNAEIIFEAAQRQLVSIEAFDADAQMSFSSKERTGGLYAPVGLDVANPDDFNMIFANPGHSYTGSELQAKLLEDQVSEDLYAGGWIVEYDNISLQVKSVFYFKEGTYSDFYTDAETNASLRASRENRLNYQKENGKVVGYFDGSTSSINTNELKVTGSVQIENKDELIANAAIIVSGKEETPQEYQLIITTTGESSGAKVTQVVDFASSDLQMNPWSKKRMASVSIILDSLKTGKHFKETYGSLSADNVSFLKDTANGYITINGIAPSATVDYDADNTYTATKFIPGENVTVSVVAQTKNGALKDEAVKATANSLYAKAKDDSDSYLAEIAYGRHLQNLDLATSGLVLDDFYVKAVDAKKVNYSDMVAVQTATIDFAEENGTWLKTYSPNGEAQRTFVPIINKELKSFTGGSVLYEDGSLLDDDGNATEFTINNMILDKKKTDSVGLFAEFYGDSIEYVTLINEQLKNSSDTESTAVGGLVGTIPANKTKSVKITGCQVILDDDGIAFGLASGKKKLLSHAANVGGLVGAANRTLEISYSSASTILTNATANAGGLVGMGKKVVLDRSYADCFVGGKNVGGLIGACDATSTIRGCYSAGFVIDAVLSSGGKIAGITPCEVASIKDSYTVFHFGDISSYDKTQTFYVTVAKVTNADSEHLANVYYIPANFDIAAANKVGVDRSVKGMKNSAITGFAGGYFAFNNDDTYGRNTVPYNMTKQTSELKNYQYPMIIAGEKKTFHHYGDWYDMLRTLNVRFLYSDQAVELKDAGMIALADPLQQATDGKIYFTEDYVNAIVAHQQIQEYSNAFIPQQDYRLLGREKAILYWQFTYEGEEYFYVPDRDDSYTPPENRKRYIGRIYRATDCQANITAGNVAPWHGITPVEMTNPMESVTQSMDMYARFYITDTIQYIRLHYRIFEDSNRDLSTAMGRYIGKANVIKNQYNKYTASASAHANIGGYHFFGWATTETGYDGNGKSTILPSTVATEESQQLVITADAITSGDLYAIYERIGYYQVNVEFCVYDSNSDGWGPTIYQPQYNTYSMEDWIGDKEDTRKILLPKLSDVAGYTLRQYGANGDSGVYKSYYFDGSGNRNETVDSDISYDTGVYGSLEDALNAGGAYVTIDIRQAGTYVVTYKGLDSRRYRVDKIYENTANGNGFNYSAGTEKRVTGTVYDDGVVGGSIASDKLASASDMYELDRYGANATPVIGNVDGTYVCEAYYKRKQFALFYDLNGGVYDNKGYRAYDTIENGRPLASVDFINEINTDPTKISMSGCEFAGWTYYKYSEAAGKTSYAGLDAYTQANMPQEALIAVAQWRVGAATPVRLEIYRQDRTNALVGTNFNDLTVPNENKTYLLQKSLDITSAANTVALKQQLLNTTSLTNLISTINTNQYRQRIGAIDGANGQEMVRLMSGNETQYYFDASTVSLPWNTIKPSLENGTLVVRLYYDRRVITMNLLYGSASNTSAAQRDWNQAWTNSASDFRIRANTYTYYYGYRTGYMIEMKALYGTHFDEPPYVWTDELWFKIGSKSSWMDHPDSIIDETATTGAAMGNPKTTWNFTFDEVNSGNRTLKLYKETADVSDTPLQIDGGTHYFDLANPDYAYPRSSSSTSWFDAGTFHGYTIKARSVDGGTLAEAADGVHYSMSEASELYLLRKSGMKVLCDGTVATVDGNPVTNGVLFDNTFYGDVLPLPATATRATDNDKYTFAGWYATSDFSGSPITQVTMDDRDMQVFAKWTPTTIHVTYHPQYPDDEDAETPIVADTYFGTATGELKTLSTSDNARISSEGDAIYYSYTPVGEDHESKYRFDGWWRKDANGNYTVRLSGSEVLYDDNTDVYARWTQVEGYAYLKYRCIMVDDTSVVHEEMSDVKILLGSPQYVYAPLVNTATWNENGHDWSGYYPMQTRVKQTFTGEEPEIVFYYSKGTALHYVVNYYVIYNPMAGTTGTQTRLLLKTQEYTQSLSSAVVIPPNLEGYVLTGPATSVTVDATYMEEHPDGVDFEFEPALSTIRMEAKTIYGTHQSFPEVLMDEVNSLFGIYPDALDGYELVPMYKIEDMDGNVLTNGFVGSDDLRDLMNDLPNGTYRAKGQVRLQLNGADVLTLWENDAYVNFTMVSSEE